MGTRVVQSVARVVHETKLRGYSEMPARSLVTAIAGARCLPPLTGLDKVLDELATIREALVPKSKQLYNVLCSPLTALGDTLLVEVIMSQLLEIGSTENRTKTTHI